MTGLGWPSEHFVDIMQNLAAPGKVIVAASRIYSSHLSVKRIPNAHTHAMRIFSNI